MNRLKWQVTLAASFALGLVCFVPVHAGVGKGSATKVKASATATKAGADGKQTVMLTLSVEKGWSIHANPVNARNLKKNDKNGDLDAESLAGNRTLIKVAADKPLQAKIDYPAGKAKILDTIEYNVYEPSVTIPIQVQRTAGDTSPLKITIDVNACDKSSCMPRGTLVVTVP